jgi:hypothetical protein
VETPSPWVVSVDSPEQAARVKTMATKTIKREVVTERIEAS